MNRFNCIQFIDDDESTIRFHEIILNKLGFKGEIIKSKNGKVALDILLNSNNKISPDLIFVDLNMPVMDGFRFIQLYINTDEFMVNRPKIVVLTTSLIPEEKLKALENKNITKFINKPLTKKSLLEVLKII